MGGRLGSGRQWMPWIHIKDMAGIALHASRNEEINGPMNAVEHRPVTNVDFTRALAHALHRPALLPVPRIALRFAFGELSDILIASQRVFPRVAEHNRWKTRIETFEPASYFTDIQLSGPYRRWHHRHEFVEVSGGTEMKYIVDYELPLGPLGVAARRLFVHRALDRIFDYRRAAITEIFGH